MLQQNPNFSPDIPRTVTQEPLSRQDTYDEFCTYASPLVNPYEVDELETLWGLEYPQTTEEPVEPSNPEDEDRYTKKDIVIQAAAVAAILGAVMYGSDVAQNKIDADRAEPGIKVIAQAKDPANALHAVLLEDGFNTLTALHLGDTLKDAIQEALDGQIWVVESNNADRDVSDLYEKAVELVEGEGITSMSIVTYSAGDMRSSGVFEELAKKSDIPIDNFVIMSGPSGEESLQPERKSEMFWAQLISEAIPGSRYSTFWRWVAEVYFYHEQFLKPEDDPWQFFTKNIPRLQRVLKGIDTRFKHPITNNDSMLEQMDDIVHSNPTERIERAGNYQKEHDKQLTNIVFIGSTERDAMIDQDKARADFKAAAEAAGLPFFTYDAEGVQHGNYWVDAAIKAYEETFRIMATDLDPQLIENRAQDALRTYEAYLAESATGEVLQK